MRLYGTDLTLSYDKRVVASDLNVTIPDGSFTVIIGPNACGKSTMLRALARMLKPRAGTVHLDGAAITGLTADGVPTHDIDGQWYGRTWRPALTDLKLGWESYGGASDTLWFDDVALGSSRIGC